MHFALHPYHFDFLSTKLFLLSTVFSRHDERGKSSLLEIGIGWLQAQAKYRLGT
jgi:hypothetical protein